MKWYFIVLIALAGMIIGWMANRIRDNAREIYQEITDPVTEDIVPPIADDISLTIVEDTAPIIDQDVIEESVPSMSRDISQSLGSTFQRAI